MADGRANNGGARPGSGRKSLRERFGPKINKSESAFAAFQESAAKRLIELANASERIEEEYAAAATLFIDEPVKDEDGEIVTLPSGRPITRKVLAFPNLPPDTMVLVKRKKIILPPDRESNIYITDRIQGKPVAAVEAEIGGPDGGAVPVRFVDALNRVWGADSTESADNATDATDATDTIDSTDSHDDTEAPQGGPGED